MSYVIQIVYLGGSQGPQEPSQHDGQYVYRFDPDAHGGRGQVWTTPEPSNAAQFDSQEHAVMFYRQVSAAKPKRPDGKPNRPLTAFTVTIFDWEKYSE